MGLSTTYTKTETDFLIQQLEKTTTSGYKGDLIKNTEDINKRCKMKKRQKQYLIATFQYEEIYVGLLELENNPSSAAATWVIISRENYISEHIFNNFISFYLKDNL